MKDFFRFPHTPHLAWLGDEQPRDDKLLGPAEVADLLGSVVVVEEKIDGANLGFSLSEDGQLQAQNRGTFLERGHHHPQFRPLWLWLATREAALVDRLSQDLMLFGEWCVTVHSIRYSHLPDWFLGFDVYDRVEGQFWDTVRRDALLEELGLFSVPRIARGRFTTADLEQLFGPSRVGTSPMEGLVIRREELGWTTARAKLVQAGFLQSINGHWSRGPYRRNALAGNAPSRD